MGSAWRGMRLGALLAGAAFVATACGSSSTPAAPTERVLEGGTFRQGLVRLASQDPAKAQSVSERVMADQLYDGLTAWNTVKNQAGPSLATAWTVSDDGLHWSFTLANAKASNGAAVTATDVKRTFEHIARRGTGSLLAETLSPVAGWSDFTNNASASSLAGIAAVDAKTVNIDLVTPFAELPSLLSNPSFGIVHYEGDSTYSTGPFMVGKQDGDVWTLAKVPGARSHLDAVQTTFFDNASASYAAFKTGALDWTPVAPADVRDASAAYGTSLFKPSLRTLGLSFNLNNPKFADVRFREAIVRATERAALATKLDLNASVMNGIVPESVVGEQAGGCGSLCFYDRNEAASLVKQVYPNGSPPIVVDIVKGSFSDAAATQLTENLAAIGVTATVRATDPTAFAGVTVDPNREMFQTSWSAAYPTAGAFIDPLYRSGAAANVSGLKSAPVDKFLDEAFKSESYDGRINAYRDAEKAAMKELPVMPVAQFPATSVQSSRMRGISLSPMGTFDIADVWAAAPVS